MKPARIAVALFVLALIFYTITLQPSLAWGDGIRLQREAITAESFIFAEMVDVTFAPDPLPFARLGVAAWDHPLYVITGHLLVQSLPMLDPLWVVNVVSALFAAATLSLFFLWCRRRLTTLAALFATVALGVSHTFWWHAATPEVYSLFTFLLLATILLYERFEETGRHAFVYAAAFTLGLGTSNHLLALLAVGAWALKKALDGWAAWRAGRSPRQLWREAAILRLAPGLLLFFLLGFAPYLIQLLRLLRTFPLSEVLGPAVGATFLQGSLALAPAALLQSIISYLTFLFYQFSPFGVALGLYGWWQGPRLAPQLWQSALALYVVYLLFGLVYGVSDQFAFFLGAHLFWAAAMALGVDALARRIPTHRRSALRAGLVIHLVLMPLLYSAAPGLLRATGVTGQSFGIPQVGSGVRDGLAYYLDPNKFGDREAYHFGQEVLQSLPPDALVVAEWYVDTDEYFILRYFIAVEGLRPDVEVLGWPTVDPFQFDTRLVTAEISEAITRRPVYLASLSDTFYAARQLLSDYCIREEAHLYRVYAKGEVANASCMAPDAATD